MKRFPRYRACRRRVAIGVAAVVVLGTPCAATAQQRTIPTPAFVQTVFDDLVRAVGDPMPTPALEVVADSSIVVARFDGGRCVVELDARFLALCAGLGSDSLNALAYILGHELAHYYNGFRQTRDFGNPVPGKRAKKKGGGSRQDRGNGHDRQRRLESRIACREEVLKEEEAADLYAGFYAAVAGYDASAMAHRVIESVYTEYRLQGSLPDYPDMAERKAIANRVGIRLQRLLPTFEMANALALAGRYPEARLCFERIIREFPGREVLNNVGVVCVLQALRLMDGEDILFTYPLELDADSRLRGVDVRNGLRADRGTRSPTPGERKQITLLLDSAARHFDLALTKDPGYAPARINRATVYILTHDFDKAIQTAGQAVRSDSSRMTSVLARTVYAIAQARRRLQQDAHTMLLHLAATARELDIPELVQANLAVVEGRDFENPRMRDTYIVDERIGMYRATDTSMLIPAAITDTVEGRPNLHVLSTDLSGCFMMGLRSEGFLIQFIRTVPGYGGSSNLGIRIGSTGDDVKRLYGDKPRVVNARQGRYFIYDHAKLIFLVSPEGRVLQWAAYAMQ